MELKRIIKTKNTIYQLSTWKLNSDYIIWCETWLDDNLYDINNSYESFQTKFAKYQGV